MLFAVCVVGFFMERHLGTSSLNLNQLGTSKYWYSTDTVSFNVSKGACEKEGRQRGTLSKQDFKDIQTDCVSAGPPFVNVEYWVKAEDLYADENVTCAKLEPLGSAGCSVSITLCVGHAGVLCQGDDPSTTTVPIGATTQHPTSSLHKFSLNFLQMLFKNKLSAAVKLFTGSFAKLKKLIVRLYSPLKIINP